MSEKLNLKTKFKDKDIENIVATVFFGLITLSLAIIILGGVWAIGDLFSTQKFVLFSQLSFPSQIFIAGFILVIIFFLCIILLVVYRRGKTAVLNSLFKAKPEGGK
ncbi:MAG: hypothetical protein GY870_11040, partial [archaeon]|nr:hypothetical protein [archaeon]